MTYRFWTSADMARLAALYPDTSNTELARLFGRTREGICLQARKHGLSKSEAFMRQHHPSRWRAGHVSWNAGKPHAPEGSRATQFRTGHRPWTHRQVGAERIDRRSGHLLRKIADTGNKRADWRPVKDLVWEAAHGVIPAGHFVSMVDRNPGHIDPANLMLVTRGENMRRNSIHTRPAEEVSAIRRATWRARKSTPLSRHLDTMLALRAEANQEA